MDKIHVKQQLEELMELIQSGRFGTKHRAQLWQRVAKILEEVIKIKE